MNEFCVPCVCVGSEVESRGLRALTCILQQRWQRGRLKGVRRQKKKIEKIKKHISILSAVLCLCLHQNVCFLRMKVVFVLTLLRIWVDKVSKPCEEDGHLRNMNLRLCDSQDRSEEPVMCA